MAEYTEKQKEQRRKAVADARDKGTHKGTYWNVMQRFYKRDSCKRTG